MAEDTRVRSRYFLTVDDAYDGPRTQIEIQGESAGVAAVFPGYSDSSTADEFDGPVVLLELRDGVPFVVVWADINQEDPTHVISLAGAAKVNRRD